MHESRHILDLRKKQVEDSLGTLFQRVGLAISQARDCLTSRDLEECEKLVRDDTSINDLRRVIEQDCLAAIASQQPVAHDLRDLIAVMRMAAELERMGDYASDIASSIKRMDGIALDGVGLALVLEMAGLCQSMLTEVMKAHQNGDAGLARLVGAMDDQLDAFMNQTVTTVMAAMRASPEWVNNGSHMLWIAHNLERCGDRCTNIAEQTIFHVEGNIEELD